MPKKSSRWFATPQEMRNRKNIMLTLPEAAIAKLSKLAKAWATSRSKVVEALIMTEEEAPDE